MSNPSLDQIRGGKAPSVTELVAETRIDAAHPARSDLLPSPAGRGAGGEGDLLRPGIAAPLPGPEGQGVRAK